MTMRQQPCPYRIVDDMGGGFAMGCGAGCLLYLIRGMWHSPKSQRLYGGIMLLKKRAPILGGSFGLWAGLFSISNCVLISIRNKQDIANQIIAGGVTGGLLAFRSGRSIAVKNAIFGAIFLAAIGVVQVCMIKYQRKQQLQMQNEMYERQIKMRRKQFAKMRPDLFSPTGQVLVNGRVPSIAL